MPYIIMLQGISVVKYRWLILNFAAVSIFLFAYADYVHKYMVITYVPGIYIFSENFHIRTLCAKTGGLVF